MMPCCLYYSSKNWNIDSILDLKDELLKYHIVHFTGFHRKREILHKQFFELQQKMFDENITIVVMNFKRPNNLLQHILPYYDNIPIVDQIVVVHCLEYTTFDYISNKVQHVYEHDTDKEYGVFTRYIAAKKYAKNACILFTDDDVIIPTKTMSMVYQKWKENINRVVGVEGRKVYKNTTSDEYEYKTTAFYGDVDFVLTSCCMTSLDNVEYVCSQEHTMHDYASTTKVKWNGEDIFLGLEVQKKTDLPCYALNSNLINLVNTDHAISKLNNHIQERTSFLRTWYSVKKL